MAFTQQMSQSVIAVFSKSNYTENIGTAKKTGLENIFQFHCGSDEAVCKIVCKGRIILDFRHCIALLQNQETICRKELLSVYQVPNSFVEKLLLLLFLKFYNYFV